MPVTSPSDTKKCNDCLLVKSISEFYIRSKTNTPIAYCKECWIQQTTKYQREHKDQVNTKNRLWRLQNPKYVKGYEKKRKAIDIEYKLSRLLRDRLRKAIKHNYKSGSAVRDLGCSIKEFKAYLEKQFKSGMTWDNHGYRGWHMDHIKPLSSFDLTDRNQLLEACNYTNLQPLWAEENIRKRDKVCQ